MSSSRSSRRTLPVSGPSRTCSPETMLPQAPAGQERIPACGYESPDEETAAAALRYLPNLHPIRDPEKADDPSSDSVPNFSNVNGILSETKTTMQRRRVGLRDRIGCYQWTWFTMNMATGGIASVLFSIPFQARWLVTIGSIFCVFNLCLFVMNVIFITMRFQIHHGSFVASFTDQFECLFISAILVSMAVVLVNACEYGIPVCGPWLVNAMEAMFWVYVSVSMVASAGLYLTLWSTLQFPLQTMTPVWVFPAYPLLLSGTFAGSLIQSAANTGRLLQLNSLAITLCAVAVQGTGFLIAFMICAAFLYRLMTQKLPRDSQRPGIFISIGPSGFTVASLVHLGRLSPVIVPDTFLGTAPGHAVDIIMILSAIFGLWLWGLSLWFFLVSVGALWKYVRPGCSMPFNMTWFSFVFPNTALVTATEQLANVYDSTGLRVFACVMAGCIILVWFVIFSYMIRCLWRKKLLWPPGEDTKQGKM